MKKTTVKTVASVTLITALGFTGCLAANGAPPVAAAPNAAAVQKLDAQTHYSDEDLTWDSSDEEAIDLANPAAADGVNVNNGTITITADGTYRLSGEYNGQVKIEAGKSDTVRLVLDNAKIANSTGPAINVAGAGEAIIYTASGTANTIADGANYAAKGADDPDAAIYSTANLTLAGEGSLFVKGSYKAGVHTTDGLVIANGTLDVNAAKAGIKGKDYVDIVGGTVKVTAGQDGIKSTNTDDENKGFTRLSDGSVTISAGDDGLKAPRTLEISGGTLNIEKSDEGIEGQYVNVLDGEVTVNSTDDGINASLPAADKVDDDGDADQEQEPADGAGAAPVDADVNISGGTVVVNADADGIDTNGNAVFTGGTIIVNGPIAGGNRAIDFDGKLLLNGANVTTGSAAEKFQTPSTESTSGHLKIVNNAALTQGKTVQVADSSGEVVANYKITKSGVQLVLVSNKNIVKGQDYKVYVASGDVDIDSTDVANGATELGSFTAA